MRADFPSACTSFISRGRDSAGKAPIEIDSAAPGSEKERLLPIKLSAGDGGL